MPVQIRRDDAVADAAQRDGQALLFVRERPLGASRLQQRLDRLAVQLLRFFDVPPLVFETPQEHLIRAIGQIDRREHQDRHPVIATLDHDGRERAGGAGHHEAGTAPEKIVVPHLPRVLARGQRDGPGHEAGVDEEVGRDHADERLWKRRHVQRPRRARSHR